MRISSLVLFFALFFTAQVSANTPNSCYEALSHLLSQVDAAPVIASDSKVTTAKGMVANIIRNIVDVTEKSVYKAVDKLNKNSFMVKFKRKLGAGMAGEVYEVEAVEGIAGLKNQPMVVKLPMNFKESLGGGPMAHSKLFQKIEVKIYESVKGKISEISQSAHFPKNPAWAENEMPVAPILKTVESNKGLLIFKPKLNGLNYKDIYRKFGGKLPAEMRQELKDIYDWALALQDKVKMPGTHPMDFIFTNKSHSFRADINPTNLVWIDDPAQMAAYNLKRPSFMLYELGEKPNGLFQKLSFDEFEKAFIERAKADIH